MDHMKTTDSINRHENSQEGRKEMHANGALRPPSSWEIRRQAEATRWCCLQVGEKWERGRSCGGSTEEGLRWPFQQCCHFNSCEHGGSGQPGDLQ